MLAPRSLEALLVLPMLHLVGYTRHEFQIRCYPLATSEHATHGNPHVDGGWLNEILRFEMVKSCRIDHKTGPVVVGVVGVVGVVVVVVGIAVWLLLLLSLLSQWDGSDDRNACSIVSQRCHAGACTYLCDPMRCVVRHQPRHADARVWVGKLAFYKGRAVEQHFLRWSTWVERPSNHKPVRYSMRHAGWYLVWHGLVARIRRSDPLLHSHFPLCVNGIVDPCTEYGRCWWVQSF